LGKLIGGWQHNCLRDSFCSYRTRITQNVAQTSYEMGNSVAMVKRSYHRRQSIEAAEAWFNIRPRAASNVVNFAEAGGAISRQPSVPKRAKNQPTLGVTQATN
jgi:hypothetical protein